MSERVSRLFPHGPMPFQVRWLQDGRYRCASTYSRETADKIFDDLVKARMGPEMWLGGMVVRDLVVAEIAVEEPV